MKRKVYTAALFVLFEVIHILEGKGAIYGISIAQLWKIPVLLYFMYCLVKCDRRWFPFEKYSYLYSFENLFCPVILTYPFSIIIHASKQLPMVLFFNYWLSKFNVETLVRILETLSQFILLSSAFVLLGIISPIYEFESAAMYGEGMTYYSGMFGAVHAASSYFCGAMLVLIDGFLKGHFVSKKQKLFNGLLILIGVISLYKTFVRTGWLMFIIGCILLIDWKKINFKNIHRYLLLFIGGIMVLIVLYETNPAIKARITEKGVYNKSTEISIDGSGRFDYWRVSLENYTQNNWYGLLFGKGLEGVMSDMYNAIGHRLFSHNHFIDTLAQYGALGFILLLLYCISIYRFIKIHGRGSPYQNLARIFLMLYIVFAFFQSEVYFWYAAMFSLSLAIMYLTKEDK